MTADHSSSEFDHDGQSVSIVEPFSCKWHKVKMDERALIAALGSRDPDGVRALVDAFGQRLLRSAFLLCGNESDAQDLVQETFLQAFRSAHRFGGRSSVYTWLHAILLNLSRHYHRDQKRLVCSDELARRDVPLPESGLFPGDAELARTALSSALGRLSEPHREIIVLRFYEDLKIQEIAAHLGISCGTVKSRLHYAIAEMQKLLPGEMNLFAPHGTNETERR
jgi:RNA polymerase sigma factor (sigma-70 family)